MKKDIVIAGVGGQGNLFASNVLSQFAIGRGFEVLGTETIGAAQRGGSVVSHIRISDTPVFSPLIPRGSADVLIGMEGLELLRNMGMLNQAGYYILNLYFVPTVYSNLGIDSYPASDEIIGAAKRTGRNGYEIAAAQKAAELGSIQMTNVVLLGALAKLDDFFEFGRMKELVKQLSPKKFQEKNMLGFEKGYELVH
jgi:indolepyruvate ferredoxin oxidoreductase, beta subunit